MKTKLFCAAGVLLVVASALQAGDWPNFRGPNYDGISTETGWATNWSATPPKPVWKAKVGLGYAAVIVADGRAFTTGNTRDVDTVFCFDAQTGKVLWKHSYAAPVDAKYYEGGTSASPTVAGDRVYTLSKRGVVHCLSVTDGKVIWTKDLAAELDAKIPTWGFAGSVLIEGDRAILNVGSAGTASVISPRARRSSTKRSTTTSRRRSSACSRHVRCSSSSVKQYAFHETEKRRSSHACSVMVVSPSRTAHRPLSTGVSCMPGRRGAISTTADAMRSTPWKIESASSTTAVLRRTVCWRAGPSAPSGQ